MNSEREAVPGGRLTTLEQLAARLSLSKSTVSRALNNHPAVRPETRARVLDLARAEGFRLNSAARRLRGSQTEALGFILSPPQSDYANSLYLQLLSGLQETCRAAGKLLLVTAARDANDEFDVLESLVRGGHVDAVAFGRITVDDPRISYLQALGFPFATLGGGGDILPYPAVELDHHAFVRRAVARLEALGHRRLALISGPEPLLFCRDAERGFESALSPGRVIRAELTEDAGRSAMLALLEARPRPTAAICINDAVAFGAYRALGECRLRPGRDMAVIGANDLVGGAYLDPPLTTFALPARAAGERLAARLLERLHEPLSSYAVERFEPEWVPRGSDGPPGNDEE